MQAGVVERDPGLRCDPLGELPRLEVEAAAGWIEQEFGVRLRGVTSEVEGQRAGPATPRLAEPADLGAVVEHLRTARSGRLRHHLEDERHERAGVVGRGESVADERDRLPRILRRWMRPPTLVAQVAHRRARLVGPDGPEDRYQQNQCQQRNKSPERDQEHV